MAVDRAVIIASNPGAVARLVSAITRAGMSVDVWGYRGNRLAHSRYVRRFEELSSDPGARAAQLTRVAEGLSDRDWVIHGTDYDLYEICDLMARGAPVGTLLPVRRHPTALRDKVAVAALLDELGVTQPAWASAEDVAGVPDAVRAVGGGAMVKTVRGWGGRGVVRVDGDGRLDAIPDVGPYLVQEWVDGESVSIDLVTVRGQVAIAPYSQMRATVGDYGVCVSRRYVPLADGRLVADLERIASGFGGTWFANLTAIRRVDGSHAIVEFDARPNAWHAYLDRLGYPLTESLRAVRHGDPVTSHSLPSGTAIDVVNVSRAVLASTHGHPEHMRHALRPRAAWSYAHRGDLVLTMRELRSLAREALTRSAAGR